MLMDQMAYAVSPPLASHRHVQIRLYVLFPWKKETEGNNSLTQAIPPSILFVTPEWAWNKTEAAGPSVVSVLW